MQGLNLLPWREQLREERKREFYSHLLGSGVLALLILVLMHIFISMEIQQQNHINQTLQKEIANLDKKITTIKDLKDKKEQVVKRLELIHQLALSRPLIVTLYNEIVRIIPRGLYLTGIKREGTLIVLTGKAESNISVSALMRNIESSNGLTEPVLQEIKKNTDDPTFQKDFVVQLKLKNAPEIPVGNTNGH